MLFLFSFLLGFRLTHDDEAVLLKNLAAHLLYLYPVPTATLKTLSETSFNFQIVASVYVLAHCFKIHMESC